MLDSLNLGIVAVTMRNVEVVEPPEPIASELRTNLRAMETYELLWVLSEVAGILKARGRASLT